MERNRTLELICLLLITLVGFALRCTDIDSFGMSPDDGNYLHSAKVLRMERATDPDWLEQDLDWAVERKAYPHSYFHQYAIRWLKRAGFNNVESVRLDSAILGALSPWLLYLLIAGRNRKRWREGLLAAAMLAVYVMHTWYSRTGWGQPGCTFFYLLMLVYADRLLHDWKENSRLAVLSYTLGLTLSMLFAYGYHEMIVVHVAGLALYGALNFWWSRNEPDKGRRWLALIALAVACIPVTAWGLTLLNDEFAQDAWTGFVQEKYKRNYYEYRMWILRKLFRRYGIHERIGWIVLPLAIVGARMLWQQSREFARYLFIAFTVSWAAFFFAFRDPYLIRVYLPTFALMVGLASIGLIGLLDRARGRTKTIARVGILAVLAILATQSYATLFLNASNPFNVASFYTPWEIAHRYPLDPIVEHLEEHRQPGQILGVSGDRSPEFRLQDSGISSRAIGARQFNKPIEKQAEWILMGVQLMTRGKHTVELGGNYRLVETDSTGRLGLYRIQRQQD